MIRIEDTTTDRHVMSSRESPHSHQLTTTTLNIPSNNQSLNEFHVSFIYPFLASSLCWLASWQDGTGQPQIPTPAHAITSIHATGTGGLSQLLISARFYCLLANPLPSAITAHPDTTPYHRHSHVLSPFALQMSTTSSLETTQYNTKLHHRHSLFNIQFVFN